MMRMRPWFVALLLLALAPISEALADCIDPPGPGVNWRRCVLDRLEFKDADLTGAQLRDASFIVHLTGGVERLTPRADIKVALGIPCEVGPGESAVLAFRFVEDRYM